MCAHGHGPADRCSQCLQARGALEVRVERVEVTGPILPPPSSRMTYGRRGGFAARRPKDDDQEDDDVN